MESRDAYEIKGSMSYIKYCEIKASTIMDGIFPPSPSVNKGDTERVFRIDVTNYKRIFEIISGCKIDNMELFINGFFKRNLGIYIGNFCGNYFNIYRSEDNFINKAALNFKSSFLFKIKTNFNFNNFEMVESKIIPIETPYVKCVSISIRNEKEKIKQKTKILSRDVSKKVNVDELFKTKIIEINSEKEGTDLPSIFKNIEEVWDSNVIKYNDKEYLEKIKVQIVKTSVINKT